MRIETSDLNYKIELTFFGLKIHLEVEEIEHIEKTNCKSVRCPAEWVYFGPCCDPGDL